MKRDRKKIKGVEEEIKKFEENSRWFSRHYDELSRKYPDEYVAVYNCRIVDHDRDLDRLISRINRKYKDSSRVIAVEFVSSRKVELIL